MYADIVRELDGTYSVVSGERSVKSHFLTWQAAVIWAYRHGYHNTAWDEALAGQDVRDRG
jgi:hypothetical protein